MGENRFLILRKLKTGRGEEVHTLEDFEDNLEVLTGGGEQVPVCETEEVPTMEDPTEVGKHVPVCETEEVHTMEEPTEVGEHVPAPEDAEEIPTKEVPTQMGEEQSVNGDRRAVRCQNRARVMVDETTLEVPPDEGEDLPEDKLKVFEDLIQDIPPDEDDGSKIIKEEFLQHIKDAKVVSKKSGELYKDQSGSPCLD